MGGAALEPGLTPLGSLFLATLQPLTALSGTPIVSAAPGPTGAFHPGDLPSHALQPLAIFSQTPSIPVQSQAELPQTLAPSADAPISFKNEHPLSVAASRMFVDAARIIAEKFPGKSLLDFPDSAELLQSALNADQVALDENLVNGLLRYHRLDGRDDGSGLSGVQYPPIPGVAKGDDAALKAEINRMASFLAGQPGIEYKPAPSDPQGRAAFRKQIAQQSADEIKQYSAEAMNAAVASLPEGPMKVFVQKALLKAQPEFWRAPSSSSGKYHPADEINYGGLLVHSVRNVLIGKMLSEYFGFERPDRIAAALILHDIQKGGIPWKHTNKPGDAPDSGYVADHGPVAAEWLKGLKDECGSDCDAVIDDVSAHMAQWNKPAPTPPQTLEEQIVSYADYLASRDDVYVRWRNP
jgi:hypothetical protein